MLSKKNLIKIVLIPVLFCACSLLNLNKTELKTFHSLSKKPSFTHGLKILQEQTNALSVNTDTVTSGILNQSNDYLQAPPPSVTNKPKPSPAGDFNDYVSQAPYWWPNPKTEDGLPYIKKDGETNPEVYDLDPYRLGDFKKQVLLHTSSYVISDDPKYAKKAIDLLEAWFVKPDSKMDPHLKYAQGIPGKTTGRFLGIIDGRNFIFILDTIGILKESKHWNESIENIIYRWYYAFNDWLWNSHMGEKERNYVNNHGSWYDFQTAFFSAKTGNDELAKEILTNVTRKRIDPHIDEEGKQPIEIKRTRALHYSIFNLLPLTYLADLGQLYDISIWEYPSKENSKLLSATDYLIPYIFDEKEWPYQQKGNVNKCAFAPVLQSAFNFTKDEYYLEKYQKLVSENCRPSDLLGY